MDGASFRAWLAARSLFGLQLALGAVTAGGLLIGLAVVRGAGVWAPAVVLALLALLGLCVAGLYALERCKPLATPVSGPESWARHVRELRSSRMEIVNAFEIERRRLERDLHDGAQQHLVASSLKIGEATLLLTGTEAQKAASPPVRELLDSAQDATEAALADLRATVSGIHPTVLSDLGLESAVREMAHRSPLNVVVRVPHPLPPIPEGVAAAAYFLVSESVTNTAKHAPRAQVTVLLAADEALHVSVVDNGPGGAVVEPGRGLAGMAERLQAFGGTLELSSPAGGPTSLTARVPVLLGYDDSSEPSGLADCAEGARR